MNTKIKMSFKHDEKLDRKKINIIGFVSFLMGFSQAVAAYVLSSYFKTASGTENVGLFYTLSYAVVLVILLNFHKVIRKLGKSNVFYFSVLAKIAAISFLAGTEPSVWTTVFLILYLISGALEWVSLDIILESFSRDAMSGRIRGLHLTILNAGYLAGPFISSRLLENFGFSGIFSFLLVFNSAILVFSLIGLRDVNHKFDQDLKVTELLKKVWMRKNVLRIYYVSFILEFFYALMVIYTPIYLRDLGISWNDIGIMFTIMLLPFVFLQYPAGLLADKKLGEKELIIASIFMMGISTSAIYFLESTSVLAWGIILFFTRIGASLLEILRDSYFYKRIDGHDVDLINFFRTSMPVAYIVSTGLSFIFLIFFPIKAAFIFVGLAIFSSLIPAFRLVDNKCERESLTRTVEVKI